VGEKPPPPPPTLKSFRRVAQKVVMHPAIAIRSKKTPGNSQVKIREH